MGLVGRQELEERRPRIFGTRRDVLVHELTHVWQFKRGFNVKSSSLVAQKFGMATIFLKLSENIMRDCIVFAT